MVDRVVRPPAQELEQQLQFGRYFLDFRRGALVRDGREVPLRPKTFAVLQYLVRNSGRLVSKDELFAAVWPGLAVSDDTLVQSIGELRRAFGNDGPLLIRTVPRRGYRFEAASLDGMPTTSDELVPSIASAILPQARRWEVALTNRRGRMAITLVLLLLLAAGAIWNVTGDQSPFRMSQDGKDQATERVAAGIKPAIAVLPFINQSDDPAQDVLVDGLTQDVITALGRFSALTVMSWNAVQPYKGKIASPDEIGRGLDVRYQIEGGVRPAGKSLRVSVRIVDTEGRVFWSSSFEEALADVFALQDKIVTQLAGALAIRITQAEQQRVLAKPTQKLQAYEYVLRARPALNRPERGNVAEARVLLNRAIELDPNYAAAYSALAETHHTSASMGWTEAPAASLSRAAELASRALSLDDLDVRARIVLGRVHLFYRRYEQAKAEIDKAIAVNPSDAHALAARGNVLMWLGQTDAAIEDLELAERIDPRLNVFDRNALAMAYYLKARYQAAIRQAELTIDETGVAHFSRALLAAAFAQLDQTEEARRTALTIQRTDPTFDAEGFGTKFLNTADLARLREGLWKAGLYTPAATRN